MFAIVLTWVFSLFLILFATLGLTKVGGRKDMSAPGLKAGGGRRPAPGSYAVVCTSTSDMEQNSSSEETTAISFQSVLSLHTIELSRTALVVP